MLWHKLPLAEIKLPNSVYRIFQGYKVQIRKVEIAIKNVSENYLSFWMHKRFFSCFSFLFLLIVFWFPKYLTFGKISSSWTVLLSNPFNRKPASCIAMTLQRIASGHFSVMGNGQLPLMAAANCTNLTAEWEPDELIAEGNHVWPRSCYLMSDIAEGKVRFISQRHTAEREPTKVAAREILVKY